MESLKKKHLSDVGLWPADIGISGQWCIDLFITTFVGTAQVG
jgi:hypothetical protein